MNRPIRSHVSTSSLSLIGIPKKFHSSTLEDFIASTKDLEELKSFVRKYLDHIDHYISEGSGIYFYGSNGVGKTMLSSILGIEAYRHRFSTRRTTFVEYMSKYTRLWGCKDTREKDALEQEFYTYYKSVEFLILEEVGKEIDSKASAPILEDLLRYREDRSLCTIICSNLQIGAFRERYGDSCFSILQGCMTPVCIEGKDERYSTFTRKEQV